MLLEVRGDYENLRFRFFSNAVIVGCCVLLLNEHHDFFFLRYVMVMESELKIFFLFYVIRNLRSNSSFR